MTPKDREAALIMGLVIAVIIISLIGIHLLFNFCL